MNRKVHQRQKTKLFQKNLLVGYFNFSHDKKQFILILSNHQLESEHSFLLQINLFHRIGSQRKELRVNVRAQRCYKIQKGCGTKSTNELYQSSCCCCSEVFRQTFIPFPLQSHYFQSDLFVCCHTSNILLGDASGMQIYSISNH